MISLFLPSTLLFAICTFAAPAPYVVTSYVQVSVYTYGGESDAYTTYPTTEYTYTEEVVPTATPVTNAISTATDASSYADVTLVNIILPPGSGRTTTANYDGYSSTTSTSYVVPVTYTPSATCTGQNWTFVTNLPVDIPSIVQTQLTPATITPTVASYTYYYDNNRITRTTAMIAVLDPTDVPADTISSLSSDYAPYYMSYCYTPTTYCETSLATATCTPTFAYDPGYGYSGSTSPSSSSTYYGYCYYGCGYEDVIIIAVCVPVGWILLWILIGLWENWMSFKGLMLGKQRKRGMPYSWCCLSCLFLCWVGPTYKAKSVEEQAELKEKWQALKASEKFKLWWSWGLRWKYPDVLGPEPEKDKRAFRQRCL
ncbi:hypothetical protein BP5796_06102 [Coleophoma crateriformis]|uniref:Uncharacterized protein n=1 Tax=Coleophoma crateriformis TaxID=565419 RepID=A0A3D8RWE7_9HELO|nr:hypothetical protein BP5796_06102 [Coleophoma crateriformis]